MGDTYWYAYDGKVSSPYFETKAEAAEACDDGETPRPVDGDVIDVAADGEAEQSLDEMSHDELKAEAEARGVADDIDLRSKASIREALRDA